MPADTEKNTPGEGLTVRQRQAAVLDAAGFTLKQIGAVLNLHDKTVGRWRQRDEQYQVAVEEYKQNQVQEIAPVVDRIQVEMAGSVLKAIRTINEAMDATTRDGNPSWAARLRGAADALSHAKLISPDALREKAVDGRGGGGPQYAVIRVEVPAAQEVKRIAGGSAEVIEAKQVKEEKRLETEAREIEGDA